MGVQHQNIHDKSREGSWGFNTKTYMTRVLGFNTKTYMTSQGRGGGFNTKTYMTKSREGSWGFNTKTYMTKSREGSWGFNTKTYMTNPGRVLGGSTPKHT